MDVRIVRKKKDYLLGHIVKVHEVDKKRLDGDAKCPHHLSPYTEGEHLPEPQYGGGGCKRQAVSYESQLQLKHEIVTGCFDGILGLEILPIL